MDEPVPEYQPGDVVEVTILIEHAANLDAVKVAFVHEEYPRDVRFDDLDVELSAGARTTRASRYSPSRNYCTGPR